MLYPKKLSWILALLLCCRVALAGNLQISPEAPVAGDRILLSLDEYLPDEAKVTWKYQQADESQWHEIEVSDGYPEFVAKGTGKLIVRCEITAADDTKKRLHRIVSVNSTSGRSRALITPRTRSERQFAKQQALDKRLESKYDVAQKTSAAIHESRIYQDDQQFLKHAQQVAEIYLRGADNFLKIGEHPNLRNRAEATQQLVNELAKFKETLDSGSLAESAWSKFFTTITDIYADLYREHADEFSANSAHAAFFKDVARGINVERQEGQTFVDNYETYQMYMNRYKDDGAFVGSGSDHCWQILFGH